MTQHYIRFSKDFKVEASGAWFGVTVICYVVMAGLIVGELIEVAKAIF